MKQFSATIIDTIPLCADFFELEFAWEGAVAPQPGQFFTVRVSLDTSPLLRRPFAFSSFDEKRGTAAMIFQKRGRGTGLLAACRKGEKLDVIGPLGKPFPLPAEGRHALLVAGGIGL
jgi:dihydroorotate dehydrogenase electron transfer subunit